MSLKTLPERQLPLALRQRQPPTQGAINKTQPAPAGPNTVLARNAARPAGWGRCVNTGCPTQHSIARDAISKAPLPRPPRPPPKALHKGRLCRGVPSLLARAGAAWRKVSCCGSNCSSNLRRVLKNTQWAIRPVICQFSRAKCFFRKPSTFVISGAFRRMNKPHW